LELSKDLIRSQKEKKGKIIFSGFLEGKENTYSKT